MRSTHSQMLCLEKDTYNVSSSSTGQKETLSVTQFEEAETDTEKNWTWAQ